MEFKTEEELIEMGKCQLIRLVLDLQNEIKLLDLPFSYLLLLRGSNSATPEVLFFIYIFKKNLKNA